MIHATYTDLSGTTRLLGCPFCPNREGLRTDSTDEDVWAYCPICHAAFDRDALYALREGLAGLDAAAEVFALWLIQIASGEYVPSPGVDPIDFVEVPVVPALPPLPPRLEVA